MDRLEAKAGETSTESETAQLDNRLDAKAGKQQLQDLRDDLTKLRTAVDEQGAGDESAATEASVTQLGERVDRLAEQVDELRTQSEQP